MGTFTWAHAIRGEHDIHMETQKCGTSQGIGPLNALSFVNNSMEKFL